MFNLTLKKDFEVNWEELGNMQRSIVLKKIVEENKTEIINFLEIGGTTKDIQKAFEQINIQCHYNAVRNTLKHFEIIK